MANDAAAAATAVTVVAQEAASPPEAAAEAAEPAVQPDEELEAAVEANAGDEKQTETTVQVMESHGNEDSQEGVTQVWGNFLPSRWGSQMLKWGWLEKLTRSTN